MGDIVRRTLFEAAGLRPCFILESAQPLQRKAAFPVFKPSAERKRVFSKRALQDVSKNIPLRHMPRRP